MTVFEINITPCIQKQQPDQTEHPPVSQTGQMESNGESKGEQGV